MDTKKALARGSRGEKARVDNLAFVIKAVVEVFISLVATCRTGGAR